MLCFRHLISRASQSSSQLPSRVIVSRRSSASFRLSITGYLLPVGFCLTSLFFSSEITPGGRRMKTQRNDFKTGFPRLLERPGFFLENSRTWKVLENHFGPGKSWKLKLKVLESPGKSLHVYRDHV